jgi:Type II secretion system (T2SS), protein E, N-terminal domain
MNDMRIRIGDLLVKAGVITDLQLKAALAEQSQWGGKLGDILVRMEFITEEVLVRALSKQTGIARADLSGEVDHAAIELVPAETAEEFNLVPLASKDEGRTLLVAMSDPGNVMIIDHLHALTNCRIEAQLAGASAIRAAIARWYRGEELATDESSMKIVNNSGASVVTVEGKKAPAPAQDGQTARASALEVLRGVEETQRRSVAALKAMVELLIEKGVFSREEYLARVKR